ncbi:hypothetical protein QWY79_08405 [Halomonas sabkhae]|uniref:hypothetical protein n=1 Tax=Halomonas sabkhae TaxID=626223 RepID=UPI0025B5E612|nr:hypothetical protein [Halomonas sabkhae]MDN3525292.1 hypothetical protein [Halomonas sabkhae]
MRETLELPQLWENTKYVSWPHSHDNPVVRIPRPSGQPESRSIARQPSEYDTFLRCLEYRDQRGPEIWGEQRWEELLHVPKRSVAKHRLLPAGPITGVFHYERPNGTTVWIATWYERRPNGRSHKRSLHFSYGTPKSRYATSEQAEAAAIEKRQQEEARWYSTLGAGETRIANR